ncbi:MAG TPA: TIM barrel protein [Verrucomicrobiae bacterium]|nr:TIM barrel protein [Verrucomicrobiae bacterium]
MILTGIGDEAGNTIEAQIQAVQELGWKHLEMRGVEVPGFAKANFHDIPDAAFDQAVAKLEAAKIGVYCFGSTIGNWGKKIEDPFEITLAEVRRCIPRMQRLGTKFVRVMSYKVREGEDQMETERFHRMREITRMFLDAGLVPVHENCMNYGGMSWQHALKLLENVPGLKWVFDTANPVFNQDHSKPAPRPQQDPWEFWTKVKQHVVHIHVKDARWNPAKKDADYTFPGEGDGAVRRILSDAFAGGYDGGISIEPHMVVVFHDAGSKSNDDAMRQNFVDYGRRLEKMICEIKGA